MKHGIFSRRILALLLSLLLFASCLTGCSAGSSQQKVDVKPSKNPIATTPPTTPPETKPTANSPTNAPNQSGDLVAADGEQISYVLVYNPKIYTDDNNTQALRTGSIAEQIDVDLNRADELTGEPEYEPYNQMPLDPGFLDQIDMNGGKAEGLGSFFDVGSNMHFYCGSENDLNTRTQQYFTCVYAGTHANIWVYSNLDQSALNKLGNAFDASIYDDCVSRFGEARFGDVLNILIYPFQGNPNTVGFFHSLDLFSTMECNDATAQAYGVNRNLNIININALWLEDEDTVISTLAHEFQHLLCFTGYFSAGNQCDIWFNEAMSGYIEEALYPGSKESSFVSFHLSERIRYGQSLYNFGTDANAFKLDIGVYGSVYLFSEYLKNIAGDDIFSRFHANWRNTYVPMNTFEGIYQVIPDNVRQEIDSIISYPAGLRFASEEEEWISKLTLSFYLSTFTRDENTPELYRNIVLPYLLYDSIVDAKIEGGGRIVLATKNGTFQIPTDADSGLVYVGLNENLEVVTDIVCK